MRHRLFFPLVVLIICLTGLVRADGPDGCGCQNGFYVKVVTDFKPEWREKKVEVEVKRMSYREEIVRRTVMVPREFPEKQTRTRLIEVDRVETRDVQKCRKVPVKMCDPDTGCSVIVYKDEYYMDRLTVPFKDKKQVTEVVEVLVCRMVPEEQVLRCMVPNPQFEKVCQTQAYVVMVPYQKSIKCPCPPPGSPNYRVEVPTPGRALPFAPGALPPPPPVNGPVLPPPPIP